jgi:hypothetical protein
MEITNLNQLYIIAIVACALTEKLLYLKELSFYPERIGKNCAGSNQDTCFNKFYSR